jgi:GT2 family glycosyltransferase
MMSVQPIETRKPESVTVVTPPPIPIIESSILSSVAVVVCCYGRPEVVRDCLQAFEARTPSEVALVVVDDASDPYTARLLVSAVQRMKLRGRDVTLLVNEQNQKYTKSINRGFGQVYASGKRWAVALNSDVMVTVGWLERLLAAAATDETIGIVCPYMSNAALLTVAMPLGASYLEAADRLAAVGSPKPFPAVTPVGACMMVRADVWQSCGPFDEDLYPDGYGEENELWGRAVSAEWSRKQNRPPFRAVVVPNAYVYHESHASFGQSAVRREKVGTAVFRERWQPLLDAQAAQTAGANPRQILQTSIRRCQTARPRVAFYIRGIKLCGGVLALVNICNQLIEHGIDATIAYEFDEWRDFDRMPCRFRPINIRTDEIDSWTQLGGFEVGTVLATAWSTGDFVQRLGRRWPKLRTGAFIQDREDQFVDSRGNLQYGNRAAVEPYLNLCRSLSVCNSNWVMGSFAKDFGFTPTTYIPIGVDPDLFHPPERRPDGAVRVLAFSRPTTPRRGYLLLERVFRELGRFGRDKVELLTYDEAPGANVPSLHLGKIPQRRLADEMRKAHLLIEPSFSQGWGMPAQEMMATGGAVISTDNGGIHNYGVDGRNCVIVPPRADVMLKAVQDLIADRERRERLGAQARTDMLRFAWSRVGAAWAKVLRG